MHRHVLRRHPPAHSSGRPDPQTPDARAVLRGSVGAAAREARTHGHPAEALVLISKGLYATIPAAQGSLLGNDRREELTALVTMVIEEYYASEPTRAD